MRRRKRSRGKYVRDVKTGRKGIMWRRKRKWNRRNNDKEGKRER